MSVKVGWGFRLPPPPLSKASHLTLVVGGVLGSLWRVLGSLSKMCECLKQLFFYCTAGNFGPVVNTVPANTFSCILTPQTHLVLQSGGPLLSQFLTFSSVAQLTLGAAGMGESGRHSADDFCHKTRTTCCFVPHWVSSALSCGVVCWRGRPSSNERLPLSLATCASLLLTPGILQHQF